MPARVKATAARRPYDLDALTDVALRVFADRGYDGASMDDVAAAAGITKAAIYHHVASKEALLARGLERALDALEAIPERARLAATPLERLRYVVRATAILALDLLPELTVLVRVRGNSATERRAIERRRAFDREVADLVRLAQAAGEIDASLDPPLTVRLVFGAINSLVEWYRPDGTLPPAAIAEALERVLFAGILQPRRGTGKLTKPTIR
ncbi:MAG: TetR/AcrR family transcriptional regulator [Vulcanimicrobiaceae bacterium]